jgi:TetR/AcrR family transcriptional regulator, regulator of cefoperazone and chloramphenicol sensitivity
MENQLIDAETLGGDRGAAAKQRLIVAATKIFADKGYANASTREICREAKVNVAAIHYYFEDKAGLYRAVFLLPVEQTIVASQAFSNPALAFEEAMTIMYGAFLVPLQTHGGANCSQASDNTCDAMRLHLRESLEPSGVLGDALPRAVSSHFAAIQKVLCHHLGLTTPDEDIEALALTLVGIACDYMMSFEINSVIAPNVCTGPLAIERALKRFVRYAVALLTAEKARRLPNAAALSSPLTYQIIKQPLS